MISTHGKSIYAQQNSDLIFSDGFNIATYIGRVDANGDICLVPGHITEDEVRDALLSQMWDGGDWEPWEWPSEYVLAVGAENLPNKFRIARVAHWGTADPAYGEKPKRVFIVTYLGALREHWPYWQDAGQTGDDLGLTDETEVAVRLDGSVVVLGGGVLCDGCFNHKHWPEGQAWAQLMAEEATCNT